ncbi:MAG: hypothetical protein RSD07_11900 [Angelakisella sp.]
MTGAKITFGLYDVTAKKDSRPTSPQAASFVTMNDLKQEGVLVTKFATLEPSFFSLDGSFAPFPDTPAGMFWGLWSNVQSREDGAFAIPPVLTIDFSTEHTSMGFTLKFYEPTGDYCNHLEIKWYDRQGYVIAQRKFTPNSALAIIDHKVENYKKVEIAFLSTAKPCRYLKLSEIRYGAEMILDGSKVSNASILEEVDLLSSSVSINTLDFTMQSGTAEFSPLNPSGLFSVLQQRQKLDVTAQIDSDELPMGGFYLESWESDGKNNVKMSAVDAIGLMDKTRYDGGIYEGVTAAALVEQIMSSAGVSYTLEPSLAGVTISGCLPICTHRRALQQVAFALDAVVDCSRGDAVKIYPKPERPTALVSYERKFDGQALKLKPFITGVDVVAHRYLKTAEERELFKDTLAPGSYRIEFGAPMYGLVVTGASITHAGVNYATVRVEATGEVLLVGKEYTDSRQTVSRRLASAPPNVPPNILKVEDATLVSASNAGAVADAVLEYHQLRYQNDFKLRLGSERVSDMLLVRSLRGENLRGMVETMDIDLTGGCIASVKMVGMRVDTLSQHYAGELRAGERTGVL